MPNITVQSLV